MPVTGSYTFDVGSSYCAVIYIDGKLAVDDYGPKLWARTSNTVELSAGQHAIRIIYAHLGGVWPGFVVEWEASTDPVV